MLSIEFDSSPASFFLRIAVLFVEGGNGLD